MLDQLFRRDTLPVTATGNDVDLFAPFFVRNADACALDDGWVLIDRILDLRRIDILAA